MRICQPPGLDDLAATGDDAERIKCAAARVKLSIPLISSRWALSRSILRITDPMPQNFSGRRKNRLRLVYWVLVSASVAHDCMR